MKRIADYDLEHSLGTGNHGEFFLARPPERLGLTSDYVAVKVLGLNTSDDAFRRVANELKLFASVECEQLVALYDAGQQAGVFFYAMEYFPRGSLGQPAEPPARPTVLRAVADAARAAHALHEAGVAHRDIKPANVLLGEGSGRLSDLGLAQILSPGQTVTGIGPVGTIEYMEPAMVLGEPAGRASDVWSLAATLHKALTGASLYGEIPEDLVAALRHVVQSRPVVANDVTEGERELIESCLAADRGERPATAADVARRLDELAEAAA